MARKKSVLLNGNELQSFGSQYDSCIEHLSKLKKQVDKAYKRLYFFCKVSEDFRRITGKRKITYKHPLKRNEIVVLIKSRRK